MSETEKVDPSTKLSEADVQAELDRFFLAATPKIYEWLRWVLALAALTWAEQQTHSVSIGILLTTTYVCSMFYFFAFFYQFRPNFVSNRVSRIFAGIAYGVLASGTWFLVQEAVRAVVLARQ